MKQAIVFVMLVAVVALAFFMGSKLSSDALGMAVGVVFGMLAGMPTALLLLASQRHRRPYEDDDNYDPNYRANARRARCLDEPYPYQPPVIVLAAPQAQPPQETHYHVHNLNGPPPVAQRAAELTRYHQQQGRAFRVIGEREEWIDGDEW